MNFERVETKHCGIMGHCLEYQQIERKEVKTLTKELYKAYRQDLISKSVFKKLVKNMITVMIERDLEYKLRVRNRKINTKIYGYWG